MTIFLDLGKSKRFGFQMDLKDCQERLEELAPAGFYVALRVGYAFPERELNCLNPEWVDLYTQRGLVIQDPTMRWIYANRGAIRWSEIHQPDPAGVMRLAQELGLEFGATVSYNHPEDPGRRSYAVLFRADRDFSEAELDELYQMLRQLHGEAHDTGLTPAELDAIRCRADGLLIKQIAAELDISESGVKARLTSACRKLGAKNAIEMLAIATSRRLI